MKALRKILSALLAVLVLCTGCGPASDSVSLPYYEESASQVMDIEDEAVALSGAPSAAKTTAKKSSATEAPGIKEKRSKDAVVDYSNAADGYVMAKYLTKTSKRLKVQVKGPTTTYTYDLPQGKWQVFPLSDGNGSYQITVFQNVSGTKYATVLSAKCKVQLKDEFAPFLHPNQYVDYGVAEKSVEKAEELTGKLKEPLDKVAAVYDFVVGHLTYDSKKAATVQSGYLPVLDQVLESKKGICFDYAALMTGMLRSQGVPCKLVVGYAGTAYHAWISVWTEESGWVDNAIFFDGKVWKRMDPTFASSGSKSASIMKYIGDGSTTR